jgi:hypothetical protein
MTIIDVPIFSHANNSSGEIWFYDQTMNTNMCMFISKALKKAIYTMEKYAYFKHGLQIQ